MVNNFNNVRVFELFLLLVKVYKSRYNCLKWIFFNFFGLYVIMIYFEYYKNKVVENY